jgi:hypothetical protein
VASSTNTYFVFVMLMVAPLGNAPGELDKVGAWLGDQSEEAGFPRTKLRAVMVGAIVSLPVRGGGNEAKQLFDGVPQGGGDRRTRAATSRATMRSAALLQ